MSTITLQRRYWISIAVFLVLVSLCAIIYNKSKQESENKIEDNIQTLGSLAAQDFERTVDNNILSLEALAQRIIESDGDFYKYLSEDSKRIITQNPALQFIERVDSTGVIREIYPLEGNEIVVDLDIKPIEYRYEDWRRASNENITNITQWAGLTQGGKAFLIDVPIYYNNRFHGTVSAGMDFKTQFDKLSNKLQDHAILIKDNKQNVFYSFNNPRPDLFDDDQIFTTKLNIGDIKNNVWTFQFMYTDKIVLTEHSKLQDYALAFGLLLSLLSSFLVFFYLKAKNESKRFENANVNLNKTNSLLEEQKNLANTASLAKTQFLSNMSHEIRTPLSAILGLTELLKGTNLLEQEKEYIKLMRHSSTVLLALVNDILDIEKIESGKIELSEEQFSPKILFENIVNTFKYSIEDKKLDLKMEMDPSNVILVRGDSSKMTQIITNIIGNAVKFTQEGYIEVKYKEQVKEGSLSVQITIKDTGIGIPKDKIPFIYDRFTQVENGLKKSHSGSGLGLAITKELIAVLGGTIKVKSKYKEGTEFSIKLSFPMSDLSPTDIDISHKDLSHIKVLIVDDNGLNRLVLKKSLEDLNISATLAENGRCFDPYKTRVFF